MSWVLFGLIMSIITFIVLIVPNMIVDKNYGNRDKGAMKLSIGISVVLSVAGMIFIYLTLPRLTLIAFVGDLIILMIIGVIIFLMHNISHSQVDGIFKTILIGFVFAIFALVAIPVLDFFNKQALYDDIEIEKTEYPPNFNEIETVVISKSFARNKISKAFNQVENYSFYDLGDIELQKIDGKIHYVADIEFTGFFRWLKGDTIPGYFILEADNEKAEPKFIKKEYAYTKTAFFGKWAQRQAYAHDETYKLVGEPSFEIDDEGHPYYIQTVGKPVTINGGIHLEGVVMLDAMTGKTKFYSKDEIPKWVDGGISTDYAGYVAKTIGEYVHGTFNFSNKDKKTPNSNGDFNGIKIMFIGGQMYYFVEFSTYKNDSNSMTEFMLMNTNNGDITFHDMRGGTLIDSTGAKNIAEKAFIEKRWTAKNPMLYEIDGQYTWLVSLQDSNNYLQQFFFVSAANHNITGSDKSLNKALEKLKKAYQNESAVDIKNTDDIKPVTKSITISRTKDYNKEDLFELYLASTENELFLYSSDSIDRYLLLSEGDTVKVTYRPIPANEFQIIESIEWDKIKR